jgi:ClpP class serine protease
VRLRFQRGATCEALRAQNPPTRPPSPQQPAGAQPAAPQLATLLGSDAADKARASQLITALEKARGNRAIVYWMTPMARIEEGVVLSLYDQLQTIGKQPQIDLVLNTLGGAVEVPWPIVNLMREFCDRFAVLLLHRAHSSGTLLCLGANEIVMTPLSILGPIDPSRTHHLLPTGKGDDAIEVSVQDMRHAMTFVKEAFGSTEGYTADAKAQIHSVVRESSSACDRRD